MSVSSSCVSPKLSGYVGSVSRLKVRSSVLLALKLTFQVLAHWFICSRSEFSISALMCGFLSACDILVSSANNFMSDSMFIVMSFIKIRKNRGPKTEPCGTPAVIGSSSDLFPFKITSCDLFSK